MIVHVCDTKCVCLCYADLCFSLSDLEMHLLLHSVSFNKEACQRLPLSGSAYVEEVCAEESLFPIFPKENVFMASSAIHSFYVKSRIIVVVIRQEHMNLFS